MECFKKNKISRLLFLLVIAFFCCGKKNELFIEYSNSQIEYWGRIDTSKVKGTELYWSGTSIKLNFKGTSIKALLEDDKGDNYYNVIIDNDSLYKIIRPNNKQYYELASNLSKGKHSIEIFKRTEWDRGKTTFHGFLIEGNPTLLPKPIVKKKSIEFYGNSITAGYAVEDYSGRDMPDSTYTNHYKSYAAITSRNYDAQFQTICKSGIGITISWFPLIMPQIYDRLNPNETKSKWDFSLYKPDLVVINLFQNDSWLINKPEREEFKNTFGKEIPSDDFFINAYQKFVIGLRKEYPKAKIICMLGSMDASIKESKWIDYIKKAVSNLKDKTIYTHFVPYKETNGHPSEKEQEEIAKSLIQFIDTNINW